MRRGMTWSLFIYRLPQKPSRSRVAVWRELRRIGSLPLGQGVVALPDANDFVERLERVEEKVSDAAGVSWHFRLGALDDETDARLRAEWNALRKAEYDEVAEECRSNYMRQVEFEIFRGNFDSSRVRELEADLERLRASFAKIQTRDLFDAGPEDAASAISECEQALADFVERVETEG